MHIPVTGLGIISSLGAGTRINLERLKSGRTAVGRIRYVDTVHSDIPVAEVPYSNGELCSLCKGDGITFRTALMGRIALREALADAGLAEEGDISAGGSVRIGLVFGTTVGGMDIFEREYREGSRNCLSGLASASCGSCTEQMLHGISGIDLVTTVSTACSSALNSIITGARLIREGRVDIALCGGGECLSNYHLNGFNSLKILDDRPCRPFDRTRAGLNLGEGAAFLILESRESARRRSVEPKAYLEGYGNACDAYHQTASSPEGEGAYLAMKKALESAGLTPSDIGYINAHGTGTRNNDASEVRAVQRLFGESIPPMSSTKGYTGHTTSASGTIEGILSILAMNEGFVPANINFTTAMEECSFIPSVGNVIKDYRFVQVNSFAFGGNDSSVIFSKKEAV